MDKNESCGIQGKKAWRGFFFPLLIIVIEDLVWCVYIRSDVHTRPPDLQQQQQQQRLPPYSPTNHPPLREPSSSP